MTTQPTPSPHQHEPAPFTTGRFKASCHFLLDEGTEVGKFDLASLSLKEAEANARLAAACFNSATALWQAGYDSQKVIAALPGLLKLAEHATPFNMTTLLDSVRRTKGTQ